MGINQRFRICQNALVRLTFNRTTAVTLLVVVLTSVLLFGCSPVSSHQTSVTQSAATNQATTQSQASLNPATQSNDTSAAVNSQLEVHFLDVGQADCTLVIQGDDAMLIDAGNNDDAGQIVNYLKDQGITRLDYLVGTHPHEDHIGSMDDVVETFEIGKVLMPDMTTNYKTYADAMQAIRDKGLTVTIPRVGQTYQLGDASFQILSPPAMKLYNINASSIVLRLVFGQTAFMLTGDAEMTEEEQMMSSGLDLKADVLKVAHHGSADATSGAFIRAVAPESAVIFVAVDNPYGYPSRDVIQDLTWAGVDIYRTDLDGDIVAVSDGSEVTFDTSLFTSAPGL